MPERVVKSAPDKQDSEPPVIPVVAERPTKWPLIANPDPDEFRALTQTEMENRYLWSCEAGRAKRLSAIHVEILKCSERLTSPRKAVREGATSHIKELADELEAVWDRRKLVEPVFPVHEVHVFAMGRLDGGVNVREIVGPKEMICQLYARASGPRAHDGRIRGGVHDRGLPDDGRWVSLANEGRDVYVSGFQTGRYIDDECVPLDGLICCSRTIQPNAHFGDHKTIHFIQRFEPNEERIRNAMAALNDGDCKDAVQQEQLAKWRTEIEGFLNPLPPKIAIEGPDWTLVAQGMELEDAGELNDAKAVYKQVISQFSTGDAAKQAQKLLDRMESKVSVRAIYAPELLQFQNDYQHQRSPLKRQRPAR